MRFALILAVLFLGAGLSAAAHPVDVAHADALRLPENIRPYVRYLYRMPGEADGDDFTRVFAGHLNEISTASLIKPDVWQGLVVPGSDGNVYRIVIADYGWDPATYERLVSPFDHLQIQTQEIVEYGYDWQGQWVSIGRQRPAKGFGYTDARGLWHEVPVTTRNITGGKKTTGISPFLADTPDRAKKLGALVGLLGGTHAPLLRARWFFQQTAAAKLRSPNYYDFLGVKNEKDFQKLIGFDAGVDKRRIEMREAVSRSTVTLQPRGIVRRDAAGGSYWYTLDFELATGRFNPLRIFGRDLEDAFRSKDLEGNRASEQFGNLPNGMWASFLGNQKGERQDTAPDFIASNALASHPDRRVHINVACRICHIEGGLLSVGGWAKRRAAPPFAAAPTDLDYEKTIALQAQYARNLDKSITRDRRLFEDTVHTLTGWSTKEYQTAYWRAFEQYEYAGVDVRRAAAELGTTVKAFRQAIDRQIKTAGGVDPDLHVFLDDEDSLPVRQWEEIFQTAAQVMRGGIPIYEVTTK